MSTYLTPRWSQYGMFLRTASAVPSYQVVSSAERLLGREDLDESAVELVKPVRLTDVAIQAHRHELREHEDALQSPR